MAKLAGLIVIYGADENDLFSYRGVATVLVCPAICVNERGEHIQILHEGGQVFRFHAEYGGISLCQDLCLVFAQISGRKVLTHEVFELHLVAVTDDKAAGPIQCVQEPIDMRRDMSACAACAQHDDFHRCICRQLHFRSPSRRSRAFQPQIPVFSALRGETLEAGTVP